MNLCGCKGVRFCTLCQNSERIARLEHIPISSPDFSAYETYVALMLNSQLCYVRVPNKNFYSLDDIEAITRSELDETELSGSSHNRLIVEDFQKVILLESFLTIDEETSLVNEIDSQSWILSQSGRRKQDYGPKVNFKHRKLKFDNYHGMPGYAKLLLNKMQSYSALSDYVPFELCNLEYDQERGSCIELHVDDTWIWGERLITLNLLQGSVMVLTCEAKQIVVYIPMPRRSILCMAGNMRYTWKHGIMKEHVSGRRIALTMREPSANFMSGDLYDKWGRELISRGTTFIPVILIKT